MGSFLQELAVAIALFGVASLLSAACWRSRTTLGLLCAILGVALAATAPLALIGAPFQILAGSLAASAIGTVLLVLGRGVQHLLDADPTQA